MKQGYPLRSHYYDWVWTLGGRGALTWHARPFLYFFGKGQGNDTSCSLGILTTMAWPLISEKGKNLGDEGDISDPAPLSRDEA